jgi:hypothetical protein
MMSNEHREGKAEASIYRRIFMTPLLVITCAVAMGNDCHPQSTPGSLHAGQPVILTFASPEVCARQAAESDRVTKANPATRTRVPTHSICVEVAVDQTGGFDVPDANGGASMWVPVIATNDANASAADGPPSGLIPAIVFLNNSACVAALPKVAPGKMYPVCTKVEVHGGRWVIISNQRREPNMETWIIADAAGNGSSLDWKLILSILIPGVLVILGWFIAHFLTSKREFKARRREARVKGLEAAYMRVASSSNREMTEEVMEKLETFVSEIQLYGTPRQVQLTRKLVADYVSKIPLVSFDSILEDLRDSLRKELQLEPVDTLDGIKGISWLRFARPNSSPSVLPSVSASAVASETTVGEGWWRRRTAIDEAPDPEILAGVAEALKALNQTQPTLILEITAAIRSPARGCKKFASVEAAASKAAAAVMPTDPDAAETLFTIAELLALARD